MNSGDGLLAVRKVGGQQREGVWRVAGRVTEATGAGAGQAAGGDQNQSAVCFHAPL